MQLTNNKKKKWRERERERQRQRERVAVSVCREIKTLSAKSVSKKREMVRERKELVSIGLFLSHFACFPAMEYVLTG